MFSLQSLLTPVTRNEAIEILRGVLSDVGFNATAWQDGSLQLSILVIGGELYSKVSEYVAAIAAGGFLSMSTGDWMTHLADSDYDNERRPATYARHTEHLVCEAGEGPYTIAVGALVVTDGEVTFRNINSGTLASGGTLDLTVQCETAGTDGNAALGTVTSLVTSYAGVTCTNTALVVTAVDEETDTVLAERCRTKWAALSVETTKDKVIYYSLLASQAVQKVAVDDTNPRGAGTVDIYVSYAYETADASDASDVETALWDHFLGDNVEERIRAYPAPEQAVTITGTVYHDGSNSTISTDVNAALLQLLTELPIGGKDLSPGPQHRLMRADIDDAIKGVSGVVSLSLTAPLADLAIDSWSVVTPPIGGFSLTYVAVTG